MILTDQKVYKKSDDGTEKITSQTWGKKKHEVFEDEGRSVECRKSPEIFL